MTQRTEDETMIRETITFTFADAEQQARFHTRLKGIFPDASPSVLVHVTPKCEHQFAGWRDFEDGRGGEQVCSKCDIGAVSASLRDSP